jgi:hypothetical protein
MRYIALNPLKIPHFGAPKGAIGGKIIHKFRSVRRLEPLAPSNIGDFPTLSRPHRAELGHHRS